MQGISHESVLKPRMASKPMHSTETALLRVFNDLLLAADSGSPAVLVLLDLTAAFDTVDHSILLSRLEQSAGITGSALAWFRSYLPIGAFSSAKAPLTCGVPQGSILGPMLFLLPLGSILTTFTSTATPTMDRSICLSKQMSNTHYSSWWTAW